MKSKKISLVFIFTLAAALISVNLVFAESIKGSIKVKRSDKASYSKLVKISIPEVIHKIKLKYPQSPIKSIRLQEEDGYLVYETLFLDNGKEIDAKVDAGNGSILKTEFAGEEKNKKEIDEKNDGEKEQALEKEKEGVKNKSEVKSDVSLKDSNGKAAQELAAFPMDKAVEVAISSFPGKAVKVELENENNTLVYGVEIVSSKGNIADVKIDAANGKLLKIEKDEDKEKSEKEEKEEQGENED
jgi:uncharacterized membrane protein YkoI